MTLAWLDDTEAKKFGLFLAAFYMERAPLEQTTRSTRSATKKHDELHDKMARQIDLFRASHRLNIFKKARLGNAFKWALKDAGYDSDDVDRLTSWVMLRF